MAGYSEGRVTPRGQLRIYLGAAAGVGKTYALLSEGHRRAERGADVVVAFAETHGRAQTAALIDGLEVIPRMKLTYRGSEWEEMDTDAVLARKPQIALVDELAHTNVPGSRHEKRWQDVVELLDAGIDVISAVNIQHLESVTDVVEQITGVPQRETVPDAVVRAADQVELVDMTAEALRRRMAHGNIYPPQKIDAALTNYFRAGNLTALRELALLWLADKVDEGLQRYRAEHNISNTWEARERVVVALTGGPEGDTLIRRAARIAARSSGGDLLAVHVTKSDGLTGANPANLARQRQLVESLGGTYHQAGVAARPPDGPRHRVADHPRLRPDRRAHRHPLERGQPVGYPPPVPGRDHAPPPARRVRARRGARAAGHARAGQRQVRHQPHERRARVPRRGDRRRACRRVPARGG
jgi:two-component system sensor histidine kinase KdpD